MKKFARAALAIGLLAAPPVAAEDFAAALTGGKWWADVRLRYEHVNRHNTLRNADAFTLRIRPGYETGRYYGFGALLELDGTVANDHYDSTVNGQTQYSVVADPEYGEVNQAYLSYDRVPGSVLAYGRQRINYDNQRFIGSVAWRQNEQTMDSFTVVNSSLPDTKFTAAYVYNVNRIFSDKHPQGNAKMSSPLLNVKYSGWSFGDLVGYGYLLDYRVTPGASTTSWGLRFTGEHMPRKNLKISYAAEYAVQRDYGDNPANFKVRYTLLEAGIAPEFAQFKLGYEVLGSNGTVGFQTPLATLHKFNGWADLFLLTPSNGLRDVYVRAGTKWSSVNLALLYHDFKADKGGARYGSEWDFLATTKFAKHYTAGLKYASYDKRTFGVDTEKLWLWVEAKY